MAEESGSTVKLAIVALFASGAGVLTTGFLGGYLSPTITTLGSIASIVAIVRVGYNYIRQKNLGVSDPTEIDYGFFAFPAYTDLKEDQPFAIELLEDREWREDQSQKQSDEGRKAFYRTFHHLDFSNTKMELLLLTLTSLSVALFAVICIDAMESGPLLPNYLQVVAETYPESLSIRNSVFPFAGSLFGIMIGTGYFGLKQRTTCPEGTPFALEHFGSYFRTEDLQKEHRERNNERVPITVAHGQEVYFCHEHSRYYVREEEWERE